MITTLWLFNIAMDNGPFIDKFPIKTSIYFRDVPWLYVKSPDGILGKRQADLSHLLDAAGWEAQLASSSAMAKAGLLSEAEPGGRAFLTALPAGRTRMEPTHFVSEVRARLGVPDASHDAWCPRCDAVLDRHSVHASMCVAGGERNQRHNSLRDLVHGWAEKAGLQPERERAGLLLPQSPDDASSARRRPADLYLPSFHGRPTAFDFAVTAPQRLDVLVEAGRGGGSAASAYADVKRRHLDTAQVCEQHGVAFVPLVVETSGAWAPEASKILHQLSRAVTLRHGGFGPPLGGPTLLEEASVLVRSWRARATLSRRAELESSWLPVSGSGFFFLTSPAEWEVEWGVPFILFGGRPAQSSDFSLLWLDGCLICRHRSSVLVLLPSTVSFSPLCGLRLLPASHPPWPPRGLPQYRSVKIVSFSDPIPFLVSPPCVQLWVPVLWQVFFPSKKVFPAKLDDLGVPPFSIILISSDLLGAEELKKHSAERSMIFSLLHMFWILQHICSHLYVINDINISCLTAISSAMGIPPSAGGLFWGTCLLWSNGC